MDQRSFFKWDKVSESILKLSKDHEFKVSNIRSYAVSTNDENVLLCNNIVHEQYQRADIAGRYLLVHQESR